MGVESAIFGPISDYGGCDWHREQDFADMKLSQPVNGGMMD